jgi:hypothetical protein
LDTLLNFRQCCIHRLNGAHGFTLNSDQHLLDFSRCRSGTLRQLAYFVSNYGKTAALFTGAGGFNGRIQCQQIGLAGNVLDYIGDRRNLLGPLFQGPNPSDASETVSEIFWMAFEARCTRSAPSDLKVGRRCWFRGRFRARCLKYGWN